MYRILVWCPLTQNQQQRLREQGYELEMLSSTREMDLAALASYVSQFDALMVGLDPITKEIMATGDRLKVVARFGVGLDSVDVKAATELGVVVTNTPAASKVAVAELTIALMFSLARQLPQHHTMTKAGRWERRVGFELFGKILGILGLGYIGKEVARRAVGLGMSVTAFDPYWDDRFAQEHDIQRFSKEQVLRRADIVTLHMPLTPTTMGFIGREELQMMKQGSFLINTARGGLVDYDALFAALASGHLGGAGLDVYPTEPPTASPLLGLDNVVFTPHIGGETAEAYENMSRMASDNVVAVLKGQEPPNLVNPEVLGRLRSL
jgi:D-3-phosphoglycerate dehydrogenase